MIVPHSRLLWWVGILVLPFASVMIILPQATALSGSIIIVFVVLAAADAVLGRRALRGIEVRLPEQVRLVKEREGVIVLQVENEAKKARRLRLGLAFPPGISSPHEDLTAVLPGGNRSSRVSWECTAAERGDYFLDGCHMECLSPLGFWAVRKTTPGRARIRVYPNLLTEKEHLAALFLNRGFFGLHPQRQVGQGRDFDKLRKYIPGDSYDEIHWKATAKRGRPITKVFQVERTQEVYVIIDTSRLSARRTAPSGGDSGDSSTTILERFISTGLILGLAAQKQGDLFGALTFSDRVEGFLRAKNGKAHYSACRDLLYSPRARVVTPDLDELFVFIRLRLRRRALLFFLTSLDDPVIAEGFLRNMDLICRQHLVLVNMIKPVSAEPLFADPDVSSVDDLYHRLGGHMLLHNLSETRKLLHQRGVSFNLLDNEKMCAQLVSQYISIKQRQVL